MAKQYVGARYVAVVYENPDDGSAQWKANVEYEPLTIVVASNGDSYTSKKAVPRSVGAPQDNPEYWVKTGDFNASLLALQGRVNTIEGDLNTPETGIKAVVDKLEMQNGDETLETTAQTLSGAVNELNETVSVLANRKFIFIGDSYGNETNSWIDVAVNYLKLTSNQYYKASENGAGLFKENDGGHTFADILAGLNATITDKNSITDIIIGGGVNDYYSDSGYISVSDGYTRLRNALALYPNAKCYLALFGKDNNASNYARYVRYTGAIWNYKNLAAPYGNGRIAYLHNSEFIMCSSGYFKADGIHPTEQGSTIIGYGVANGILGGDAQFFDVKSLNVQPAVTNDGFGQIGNGAIVYDGAKMQVTIPEFALNVYNDNAITFTKGDNGTMIKICTLTGGAASTKHDLSGIVTFPIHCIFAIPDVTGWQEKNISAHIDGNDLYFRNDSGEEFIFTRMRCYPVTVTLDRTCY